MSEHKRTSTARHDDDDQAEDVSVADPKRPREDDDNKETQEKDDEPNIKNPGKKEYHELGRLLHILRQLSSKAELTAEDNGRVSTLLSQLLKLLKEQADDNNEKDDEKEEEEEDDKDDVETAQIPNCIKLLQIHLKDKRVKSQGISGEYNIVNFLEGLEDGSAGVGDQDNVFVFLAPQATELWYRWNDGEQQWEWTPDKVHWMLCSRTTVSGGKWKDETPAPENVEIIGYLNAVRPVPSDELYLQRFDVLAILRQLKEKCQVEEGSLVNEIMAELNKAKEGLWIDEEFTL